ncbi:alpha/beta fold hydrolase [Pseudanabaena sp. BC1403]|uniref:alpha/beta fold hydrolase n=1 Tax=Pseudanabaena sp. BC1403 TaxID=2043171 RepID=UPI000CD8B64D|nr:alpha/beta hydrolase [Pseudanabaena sp. BC1403]
MISDRRLKVLCLHGHPGNSEAMQIFAKYFHDKGIKAISPDLRGYGNCKATVNFTMLDHIQDLWDLLESDRQSDQQNLLNDYPETEYLILGWSLGGILAMELALRAAEQQNLTHNNVTPKIAGLILIATAAKPRSGLPKIAWWEYANLVIAVALHWIAPKQRWHIEWLGKRSLIRYLIQQHTQEAYDQISHTGARAYLQTSRYAQRALMQALRQGYDRTGDLDKIQVPCLAIAAEQDRHITAASTLETAKLLPNCEYISYPNTAHLLPWEIGDRLLADIDSWCDRHLS